MGTTKSPTGTKYLKRYSFWVPTRAPTARNRDDIFVTKYYLKTFDMDTDHTTIVQYTQI